MSSKGLNGMYGNGPIAQEGMTVPGPALQTPLRMAAGCLIIKVWKYHR